MQTPVQFCGIDSSAEFPLNTHNEVMSSESIVSQIQSEVTSWPGVRAERGGGILFFQIGDREIGHLHGNQLADVPFPVRIREKVVAEGKADLHYLHPESGWITYYIHGEEDVEPIIELFRLNYDRPWLNREALTEERR